MTPVVSIVIPTYNRMRLLERVLASLGEQTCNPDLFEVVVVDDGSTDGTPAVIEAAKRKYKYFINHVRREHKGIAVSRNDGVRAARADLIIFLDSDVVVCPEYVQSHLDYHRSHPGETVVGRGPAIRTSDLDSEDLTRPPSISDYSRAFFDTCNSSIKKQALIDMGMFDEAFNEYGWEDVDMAIRLKRAGYKAGTVEGARGYHFQPPPGAKGLEERLKKERSRGKMAVVLHEKHPGVSTRLMLMMTPAFFALDRLVAAFDWPTKAFGRKLLETAERRDWKWLAGFVTRIAANRAYMNGMREALRERKALM